MRKLTIRPIALALSVSLGAACPLAYSAAMTLNDFMPPNEGGAVEPSSPVEHKGDVVSGNTMQDAMGYAYQQLMDEGADGVRTVKTKTGIGILATGSAGYNAYENINATLLSKRGAYVKAFTEAQKQLVNYQEGFANRCEQSISSDLLALDTGTDSAANAGQSSSEVCKEVTEGVLSAYITYSVDDILEDKMVKVTIATTSKTRASLDRVGSAVILSTDPSKTFEHIAAEVSRGIVPPVGAKLITNPENGESIVISFGSAIIRQNSNAAMKAKLREAASRQSTMRANNALVSFIKGSEVYWEGGFDEEQVESSEQLEIPLDSEGNVGDPVVREEQKDQFLNIMRSTDDYSVITGGSLPAGVQTRTFPSEDGYWMNALSVYMPSQTLAAQQAAKESRAARSKDIGNVMPGQSSGRPINTEGGLNSDAANPQGPSGRVVPDNDF